MDENQNSAAKLPIRVTGAAGTATIDIADVMNGGFGIWFEGQFIGKRESLSEAVGLATEAAENGQSLGDEDSSPADTSTTPGPR